MGDTTAVQITAAMVKELRDKSGAGMMACREALAASGGDISKAADFLRQKGIASADKKKDRAASQGAIEAYIHTGGRVGVLLELNCETDFVAKTEDFRNLSRGICMHIAALAPAYVSSTEVPAEIIEQEKAGYRKIAIEEGKKEQFVEKIVDGKVAKYFAGVCLLDQPFVKDDSKTVAEAIKEVIGKLGENIVVRRFVRYSLGEGQ
jgi:elongation factor Ts